MPISRVSLSSSPVTPQGQPSRRRQKKKTLGAKPLAAATTENMNNDNKNTLPLWAETQKRNSPALTNISFALVNPQGPMNVGSCARVMQNFGIYDLKIVQGSSFVFEPPPDDDSSDDDDDDDINDKNDEKKNRRTTTQYEDKDEASETEGEMPDLFTASLLTSNKDAKKTMSGEAYRFACAADWMLERASKEAWYPDVKSATADRTVVFATTARNRDGSQPMLDSREAVGLTNEELRTAQYLVAIPTAGVGEVCGKSLKYTGSSGPTSLNLSHAVGVVAYEAFVETTLEEDRRRKSGHGSSSSSSSGGSRSSSSSSSSSSNNNDNDDNNNSDINSEESTASLRKQTNAGKTETDKLMSSGEKQQLTQALFSARRSLDVCPSNTDDRADTEDEDSIDLQSREFKAIERVLSNPNLRGRDAAVLFQVARRILAVMENNDESPLERVIVDELKKVKKVDAPIKEARNALRERFNISLTNREILEAQRHAGK
ncbi:unnamed protein product [Bathycoccus prasinos]